jgi:hypothetical protein
MCANMGNLHIPTIKNIYGPWNRNRLDGNENSWVFRLWIDAAGYTDVPGTCYNIAFIQSACLASNPLDSESETSKDKHMNLKKSWYLATRHPAHRVQAWVKISTWKILENRQLQLPQWVPHVLWRCSDADATERLQAGALGGCLGGEIQHFDALLAQQVLRRNRPTSWTRPLEIPS